MLDITFSIISHGHIKYIKPLLKSLNSEPSLKGCMVILTLNLLNESINPLDYPQIRMLIIKNLFPKGFGVNHNAAFTYCKTTWFCILNPDIKINKKEPFSELVKYSNIRSIDIIGPAIRNSSNKIMKSVRKNLTPFSIIFRKKTNINDLLASNKFFWIAGMCLLIRSNVFSELSGFDKRFYLYCEDYDLCARAFIRGYKIGYHKNVSLIHDGQFSSHKSIKFFIWHLKSLIKVWVSRTFWRLLFV